jgi:hypothetical protein
MHVETCACCVSSDGRGNEKQDLNSQLTVVTDGRNAFDGMTLVADFTLANSLTGLESIQNMQNVSFRKQKRKKEPAFQSLCRPSKDAS